MLRTLPQLGDYDISPKYGFLSSEPPLDVLPDPRYQPWETVARSLQKLLLTKRLRGVVEALPVLSTDSLVTEAEWRRAYVILAFTTHAYIWGGDVPAEVIPPSISVPFLSTCAHLELPPVATYAAVVLWNWHTVFPDEPVDCLQNLSTHLTFTGSMDESWFYLVSVAIEARAGPSIPVMIEAIDAARRNDAKIVTQALRRFAEMLDDLGTLLERMYENCDPHIFYHRIRPYLAGGKNMAASGLPNGVKFDDGTGTPPYVQLSGGSNAQSSVIQFFDIVLGVAHRATGEKGSESSESNSNAPANNFILEMRNYMPGPHRRFLEHMESVANIHDFVAAHKHNRELVVAFDASVAMLRALRDKHLRMVSRYIVVKSRESRSETRSLSPAKETTQRVNIANTLKRGDSKKLRGTGGTALMVFLKQARDETGEPAVDAWARRLLNNGPSSVTEGVVQLKKMNEHLNGEVETVGLAGTWSIDDSEGGICHW